MASFPQVSPLTTCTHLSPPPAVKRVEFVSDKVSYTVLRVRRFNKKIKSGSTKYRSNTKNVTYETFYAKITNLTVCSDWRNKIISAYINSYGERQNRNEIIERIRSIIYVRKKFEVQNKFNSTCDIM
jgi:hypothetical protein